MKEKKQIQWIVEMEEELAPLHRDFLKNRWKDLMRLRSLITNRDFTGLKKLGHSLLGPPGAFGYAYLVEIGRELENAAEREDQKTSLELAELYERFMGNHEVRLVTALGGSNAQNTGVWMGLQTLKRVMTFGVKTSSTHILVVEDNIEMRELIQSVLVNYGYSLALAENGLEALKMIRAGCHPKIILVDFEMPIMNGEVFARELRKQDLLKTAALILMSADREANEHSSVKLFEAILPKPLLVSSLVRLIQRFDANAKH